MTLIDSSAWIEWLRGSGQRANGRLRELLASGEALATTDVVRFELLAGVRSTAQERRVRGVIAACRNQPVRSEDWEAAASVYLVCRRSGFTPRSMLDCVIAAVAIRAELPVLALDRDFEHLAELTALELA